MKSCFLLALIAFFLGTIEFVHCGGGDLYHNCTLPPDPGYVCSGDMSSSGSPITSWHFVPEDFTCYPFVFYGCGGNSNRFNEMTFCETYCFSQGDSRPEETRKD